MKKRTALLLIVVFVIGIYILFGLGLFSEKGLLKSQSFSFNYEGNDKSNINDSPGLKRAIENVLTDTQGTYGIVIKNLKTNETYYLNENRLFNPGSLYKLWVMAAVYDQIEKGQVEEDEILSQDIQELNNQFSIPHDAAEMTDGTITLTVRQALNQMITISHNYAALLLMERVKRTTVLKYLEDHGFKDSFVGENPKSTPAEIASFLEKLYKGKLANPESTAKMITLLKEQTKNGKLPKYLPAGTIIAHKTGEIDYFSHDAGVVYLPKGDYIIVVMSESDNPFGAEERISNISKAVFDYFNF